MTKIFSLSIDPQKFSFTNGANKNHAASLFGEQGFCVLPGFLSREETGRLREKYSTEERFHQTPGQDFHKMSACYFYHHKTWKRDEDIYKIVRRAYAVKNQIALQPNSDQFMLAYCYRWRLDPENMESLIDAQLNHTFIRIAKYKGGEGQHGHYDYPGELQCILPLTELGKDYQDGGLVLGAEKGKEIYVDPLVKPGDLIILNSYRKYHSVRPVKCAAGQIGRMHIFMPTIPEYIFARGLGYYYFQDKKWKLYFSLPADPWDKIKYYVRHFTGLARKTTRPIDDGYKS
ncbi:MAG: hypothetical protein HY591_01535 [Candidatus Omnitrophica bacterium]|nr:hypothetical protein [Candidatus Omnitrophota bacterium]